MSGKIRRIDYFPDEYISGVGGVLRADEQGVYWMICSLIMSEGTAVRLDVRRLAGLCRLRPSDINRIVTALVDMGKLTLNDGKLCQKRAQSELELAAKRIQSARENGAKGGRPRQKTEQNQQNAKAGGFSGEKLTTNYQPPEEKKDDAIASSKEKPPAKGTRLPRDWTPSFDPYELGADLGLSTAVVDDQFRRFRDYWIAKAGKDATKLDWDATLRNWLRKAADDKARSPPVRNGHGETQWQRTRRALEELDDEISHHASSERAIPSLPKPGAH